MVLIVFLQQEVEVFVNEPFHFRHCLCWDASISGQGHWIEPELVLAVCASHVNVRRLGALVREKVETKTSDSEHCGHPYSVLLARYPSTFGVGPGGR
jgi:hypothetical protein